MAQELKNAKYKIVLDHEQTLFLINLIENATSKKVRAIKEILLASPQIEVPEVIRPVYLADGKVMVANNNRTLVIMENGKVVYVYDKDDESFLTKHEFDKKYPIGIDEIE